MKTTSIRVAEVTHDWYLIDAKNQILGRLASQAAQLLRGKNLPNFTPHMDMGNYVIIINADKVKVTGNKESDKTYFRHSGYPGGMTEINLKKVRKDQPDKIINDAVKGMLPQNSLGRKLLTHLKIYSTELHPHKAQSPNKITM